jgi:hypothetical protein
MLGGWPFERFGRNMQWGELRANDNAVQFRLCLLGRGLRHNLFGRE